MNPKEVLIPGDLCHLLFNTIATKRGHAVLMLDFGLVLALPLDGVDADTDVNQGVRAYFRKDGFNLRLGQISGDEQSNARPR